MVNIKVQRFCYLQIWQKLICNCAFSGTSVVTGFNVGQILDCPQSRGLALACAQEVGQVALAKGIDFGWGREKEARWVMFEFGATFASGKRRVLIELCD